MEKLRGIQLTSEKDNNDKSNYEDNDEGNGVGIGTGVRAFGNTSN